MAGIAQKAYKFPGGVYLQIWPRARRKHAGKYFSILAGGDVRRNVRSYSQV